MQAVVVLAGVAAARQMYNATQANNLNLLHSTNLTIPESTISP